MFFSLDEFVILLENEPTNVETAGLVALVGNVEVVTTSTGRRLLDFSITTK